MHMVHCILEGSKFSPFQWSIVILVIFKVEHKEEKFDSSILNSWVTGHRWACPFHPWSVYFCGNSAHHSWYNEKKWHCRISHIQPQPIMIFRSTYYDTGNYCIKTCGRTATKISLFSVFCKWPHKTGRYQNGWIKWDRSENLGWWLRQWASCDKRILRNFGNMHAAKLDVSVSELHFYLIGKWCLKNFQNSLQDSLVYRFVLSVPPGLK